MTTVRKKYHNKSSTYLLNDQLNRNIDYKPNIQKRHKKKKENNERPSHSKDSRFLIKYKWVIVAFFFMLLILTGGLIGLFMRRSESSKRHTLTPPSGTNPCKEFDLVAGDIKQANSVVLAINHNFKNVTVDCAEEILKLKGLQNKKHRYLVEGVTAGEIVKCDKLKKYNNRICEGWDSEEKILMHYRLLANTNTAVLIRKGYEEFIHSYEPHKLSIAYLDKQADTFLKKQISEQKKLIVKLSQNSKLTDLHLRPFTREKVTYVYQNLCLDQMQEIYKQRQEGISYHDIFLPYADHKKVLSEDDSGLISALHDYDLPGRNKRLSESIVRNLGMFKIAEVGLCHAIPNEEVCNREAIESMKDVHASLIENEDKNPYAVLVMRKIW